MPRSISLKVHSGQKHHNDSDTIGAIEFPSPSFSPSKSSIPSISLNQYPFSSPSFELEQGSTVISAGSVEYDNSPTITIDGTSLESGLSPARKETGSLSLIKSIAKRASVKRFRSISGIPAGLYHQDQHHGHNRDSSDTSLSPSTSSTSTTSTESMTATDSSTLSPPSLHRTRLLSLPSFHRRKRVNNGSEQSFDSDTSNLTLDTYDGYSVPPSQRSFEVLSRPRRTQSKIVVTMDPAENGNTNEPGSETMATAASAPVLCCRCGSETNGAALQGLSKGSLDSLEVGSDLNKFVPQDVQFKSAVDSKGNNIIDSTSFDLDVIHDGPPQEARTSVVDSIQTTGAAEAEEVLELPVTVHTELNLSEIVQAEVHEATNNDATEINHAVHSTSFTEVSNQASTHSPQPKPKSITLNPSDEFTIESYFLDELAMPVLSGTRPLSFFFCRFFWGSLWRELWYVLTRRLQAHVRRRISVYLTWWLSRVPLSLSRRSSGWQTYRN